MSRGTVAIAVGDVMGHGVAAAMLMATARGILRSRCQFSGGLGDLLKHMNELPVVDTEGKRFIWTELVGRALRENATSGPLELGHSDSFAACRHSSRQVTMQLRQDAGGLTLPGGHQT